MELDKRTALLLNTVNEACADGKYKILEEDELLTSIPEKIGMDKDSLQKTMQYLADNRYLDIKYCEEGVYCVCPLPDGRLYFEREQDLKSDKSRRRRDIVLLTTIGAFVGAFVGSVIAFLITSLF